MATSVQGIVGSAVAIAVLSCVPAAAETPSGNPPAQWSAAEMANARARCTAVLAKYKVEATPIEPMRSQDCGAPAPVSVTSIGSAPAIAFSQPAVLNCDMVAALAEWFQHDVQPAARTLLGAAITRAEVLSSYSCRNAYGRKRTKLSEHALANAIDLASFSTAPGSQVSVLADWGMTERDIKSRIAAAEAAERARVAAEAELEAKQLAAARSKAAENKNSQNRTASTDIATSAIRDRGAADEAATPGQPELKNFVTEVFRRMSPGMGRDGGSSALSLGQPSRLGGPKRSGATTAHAEPAERPSATGAEARRQFLHKLHQTACRRFGTVLGPEANNAHRNHFHLDLAERPRGNFCE